MIIPDLLGDRAWYLWEPASRSLFGGVLLFEGLHVWTADTQTAQERADWSRKLDGMLALQPQTVIPGHSLSGQNRDKASIEYTKAYLARFEVCGLNLKAYNERMRAVKVDEVGCPVP